MIIRERSKRILFDSIESIRWRLEKLQILTELTTDQQDIPSDLRLVAQCQPVCLFLAGMLRRTQQRMTSFQSWLEQDVASVFQIAESLELAMWRIGKYPVGSFMAYQNEVEAAIKHAVDWAENYKKEYLLRDLDYSSYKYLLFCFERALASWDNQHFRKLLGIELKEDDGLAVHREHIFSQSPSTELDAPLRKLWSEAGTPYEDWIWRIGNITLLEHNKNIGEASNRPVWEKAKVYCGSRFAHTQELGKTLLELDALLTEHGHGRETFSTVRLAAFKVFLKIRELELLAFIYCRF